MRTDRQAANDDEPEMDTVIPLTDEQADWLHRWVCEMIKRRAFIDFGEFMQQAEEGDSGGARQC